MRPTNEGETEGWDGCWVHHLVDIVEECQASATADQVDAKEEPEVEACQALAQGQGRQLLLRLLVRNR